MMTIITILLGASASLVYFYFNFFSNVFNPPVPDEFVIKNIVNVT